MSVQCSNGKDSLTITYLIMNTLIPNGNPGRNVIMALTCFQVSCGDHDIVEDVNKAPAFYTEPYQKGKINLRNIQSGKNYIVTVKFLKNIKIW